MRRALPESRTYLPGAGRCIYCWPMKLSTDGLTREHIIPKALRGNLILHKAACEQCMATINNQIETPTLQLMWQTPRTHLNMSKRRTTLPYGTWVAETSELPQNMHEVDFEFEELPVDEHPNTIMLPKFGPPGLLWGLQPSSTFTLTGVSVYRDPDAPNPSVTGRQAAEFQPFSPDAICRSIAKISHAAAVAEFGFDAFLPMLPDIILGRNSNISHLVGSTLTRGRRREALHEITLFVSRGHLLAKVQLFAKYGLQPFLAVVGRALPPLTDWHISCQLTSSSVAEQPPARPSAPEDRDVSPSLKE